MENKFAWRPFPSHHVSAIQTEIVATIMRFLALTEFEFSSRRRVAVSSGGLGRGWKGCAQAILEVLVGVERYEFVIEGSLVGG